MPSRKGHATASHCTDAAPAEYPPPGRNAGSETSVAM